MSSESRVAFCNLVSPKMFCKDYFWRKVIHNIQKLDPKRNLVCWKSGVGDHDEVGALHWLFTEINLHCVLYKTDCMEDQQLWKNYIMKNLVQEKKKALQKP